MCVKEQVPLQSPHNKKTAISTANAESGAKKIYNTCIIAGWRKKSNDS
jgi:hypothetical protein